MKDEVITNIVKVLIGACALAIVSILVSSRSQTGSVFSAGGGAIGRILCAALAPVVGSSCGGTTSTGGCSPQACPSGYTWDLASCTCTSVTSTIHF